MAWPRQPLPPVHCQKQKRSKPERHEDNADKQAKDERFHGAISQELI